MLATDWTHFNCNHSLNRHQISNNWKSNDQNRLTPCKGFAVSCIVFHENWSELSESIQMLDGHLFIFSSVWLTSTSIYYHHDAPISLADLHLYNMCARARLLPVLCVAFYFVLDATRSNTIRVQRTLPLTILIAKWLQLQATGIQKSASFCLSHS